MSSRENCSSKSKHPRLDPTFHCAVVRWGYVVVALALAMGAPHIVFGFRPTVLVGLLISVILAWLFWQVIVPRQLQGLRVAFPTAEKRYEVHRVTGSTREARRLLRTSGMRFGVVAYLLAFVGAVLLLVEIGLIEFGLQEGFSAINFGLALVLISITGVTSIGVALSAQILPSQGMQRAIMHHRDPRRVRASVLLLGVWLAFVVVVWMLTSGVEPQWRLSVTLLVAFFPPVMAYGRVLGSSWHAMRYANKNVAAGRASPFQGHNPSPRQQAIGLLVNVNLMAMPLVAINTLVSLVVMLAAPGVFVHSDRVAALPEYREQATVMEEGGALGFYAIEALSYVEEPALRAPLVAMVLLFLLLNVAVVGVLFVYEVARIMFLDVAEVSGRGGIHITDSRLLRAERSQQAKVLNFCFTGFAGQSMLLVALAILTFWDSVNLPGGSGCGRWEDTVCTVVEKDALEALTWMLASGGQVAFLVIWLRSLSIGHRINEVSFDAGAGENRRRLESMEDVIFLRKGSWLPLLANDAWAKALERFDEAGSSLAEPSLHGIELSRRTLARMELFAALGRWAESEQQAVSLLALSAQSGGGHARALLVAASIAQRDVSEAKTRLGMMASDDLETNRFRWLLSLLQPRSRILSESVMASLLVDPVTRRNIDLIERTQSGTALGPAPTRDGPMFRRALLGDLARLRLQGDPDRALTLLDRHFDAHEIAPVDWLHGEAVRILLHLDAGRLATAGSLAHALPKSAARHPHMRAVLAHLGTLGQAESPATEQTGMTWLDEGPGDWVSKWPLMHEAVSPPLWTNRALRLHAWSANAWSLHDAAGASSTMVGALGRTAKKAEPLLVGRNPPKGLHLHLSGLLVDVGGYPVDVGLPGSLDIDAARLAGLLG